MQEQIEKDLKAAMLSGDKIKAEVLRGLKNALQYEAVAVGNDDRSLSDEQIQKVLAREAKKRQEAADLYKNAGEQERASTELSEKEVIIAYLPQQPSEETIQQAVNEEVSKLDNPTTADMGRIIGGVRSKLPSSTDGSTIARLVRQALDQK